MSISKQMTCICCPMGCILTVEKNGDEYNVSGNTCLRGKNYGIQEMSCPMRTVTSSVKVEGGKRPVCSVKTQINVPKSSIPEVLGEIKNVCVKAPVHIGDVIIENIASTGVALVATANDEAGAR